MSTWFNQYAFAEVHPGLIVGAYPLDRADVRRLEDLRIDRVLNLAEDAEYGPGDRETVVAAYAEAGIEERRIGLVDFGRLPADRIEEGVATLVGWLEEGHRCYVHCRAGRQRSAAFAAAAVALLEDRAIRDALSVVRARKPSAQPLYPQRADLRTWWAGRDETASRRA